MKFIPSLLLSFFLFLALSVYPQSARYDIEGALEMLDEAVSGREFYYRLRESRIDSVRNVMPASTNAQKLALFERMGDEFSRLDNDSVLIYYTLGLNTAIECGNDSLVDVFRLKLAAHMPVAGFITLAKTYYESVDTTGMSRDMKYLYYQCGRDMNYFIGLLYGSFLSDPGVWMSSVEDCYGHMIELRNDTTDMCVKNLGDYYLLTGRRAQSWELLIELLDRLDPDTYMYANTAHALARIARYRGDIEAYKYYLAEAARADIISGMREVSSLQLLAAVLFKENDVARAYEYMSAALNNAAECNAVARIREISPQLPLISKSHERLVRWWAVA